VTGLPHFIQRGDEPVVIGSDPGDIICACGSSVLARYCSASNLLGVGIRCGRCGAVTLMPPLPEGAFPPVGVLVAERQDQPREQPLRLPPHVALVSSEELTRLAALFGPRNPPSNRLRIDTAMLDRTEADYDRLSGGSLAADMTAVARAGGDPGALYRRLPLAWALRHLRDRAGPSVAASLMRHEGSVAATLLGAFRHFMDCWAHHPLFAAMAATAAEQRFSFHALALFGAAKCLSDSGNRVMFRVPEREAGKVTSFDLVLNPTDRLIVLLEVYDRHEWPALTPWEQPALDAAMTGLLASAQGRINRRRPGMLVVSGGAATGEFDQPFVDGMKAALAAEGRRNRGIAAMTAILPKQIAGAAADEIRFGYGFYPVINRHHAGTTLVTPPE